MNNINVIEEQIRVTQGERFICRIKIRLKSRRDNNFLLSVSGHVLICVSDVKPVQSNGVSHHTNIEVISRGASWLVRIGGGNFKIPDAIRGIGVARLVCSRFINLLPEELRGNVWIREKIPVSYEDDPNVYRRNNLFMDISGFSQSSSLAKFVPCCGGSDGSFSGVVHDPWDQHLSQLQWKVLLNNKKNQPTFEKSPKFRRVKCSKCGESLFDDQLDYHMRNNHQPPVPANEARKRINAILDKHGRVNRGNTPIQKPEDPNSKDPVGLRVIAGLAKGQTWSTSHRDKCSHCGLLVVLLEVESSRLKAFDINSKGTIRGSHTCRDPKSDSIYAYSGGAIDSNRRRH